MLQLKSHLLPDVGMLPLDFDEVEEVEEFFVERVLDCGVLETIDEQWREPYTEGKSTWRWSTARLAEYRVVHAQAKKQAEDYERDRPRRDQIQKERSRLVEVEKRRAHIRKDETLKREKRLQKKMEPLLHILEDELVGKMSVRIGDATFKATRVSYDPRTGLFCLYYLGPDGWEDMKILPEHILCAAEVCL